MALRMAVLFWNLGGHPDGREFDKTLWKVRAAHFHLSVGLVGSGLEGCGQDMWTAHTHTHTQKSVNITE